MIRIGYIWSIIMTVLAMILACLAQFCFMGNTVIVYDLQYIITYLIIWMYPIRLVHMYLVPKQLIPESSFFDFVVNHRKEIALFNITVLQFASTAVFYIKRFVLGPSSFISDMSMGLTVALVLLLFRDAWLYIRWTSKRERTGKETSGKSSEK